ncbi:MAG: hypothetical protein R2828_22750 [Saprospiraceae bacterium]
MTVKQIKMHLAKLEVLTAEQQKAVKGGRGRGHGRGRGRNRGTNGVDDTTTAAADPGCPPDYEE